MTSIIREIYLWLAAPFVEQRWHKVTKRFTDDDK